MVTSPRRSRVIPYSDIDINFRANLNTKDIQIQQDLMAIRQSIRNILTTIRGERLFNPNFGTDLHQYPLFENFTAIERSIIRLKIFDGVENYEPRIIIENIGIYDDPENHRMTITVYYTARSPFEISDSVSITIERLR